MEENCVPKNTATPHTTFSPPPPSRLANRLQTRGPRPRRINARSLRGGCDMDLQRHGLKRLLGFSLNQPPMQITIFAPDETELRSAWKQRNKG
jgi:hypothetical protein